MKHPRTLRRSLRPTVLGGVSSLVLIACSSGTESREGSSPAQGFPETGQIQLQLTRAVDCTDLLGTIQDNVISQLGERAKELRTATYGYASGPNGGAGVDMGSSPGNAADPAPSSPLNPNTPPPTQTPGEAPSGAPSTEDDAVDNGGVPSDPRAPEEGGGFSGTTVQVKDVDEADIVKTDGNLLYLLHGATLFVLAAWPAQSTEIVASTLIEGQPVEMFVKDGKAVVFSRLYRDLARESGLVPASSSYYVPTGYTKLTVLDVSGATPTIARESYVEGDYLSARRHDGIVRAVVQDGFKVPPLGNPSIEYTDPFGQRYPQEDIDLQVDAWLERVTRSIRSTEIGAWLPREFSKSGGTLEPQPPRCGDYYAPDAGLTQSGVTSVVSLDLNNVPAPLGGATILGQAERVYSNEDVVLVTQSDYRFFWSPGAREQTIIHRFDIAGASTLYTASGAVAGSIHDQFSLDERDGIIAVSTTERQNGNGFAVGLPQPVQPGMAVDDVAVMPAPVPRCCVNGPINRVVTLETDGASLEQIGATDGFGETEQIFATRFMGDRAYVVTFRQTDPLFVVDMSDATAPRVVGELHIPGFSNFLFPLGDDHLFSIGRDATSTGAVQGLALQIFDVSNPAAPALAHKHVFPDLGDSPANVDHRAINFHADGDVVAFPHQSWQTGESTLEVFQLSAQTGFQRLGGMGMPDAVDLEQCLRRLGYDPAYASELLPQIENDPVWQREIIASCSYDRRFVRGLFRDDVVYGISTAGVYAYDINALDAGALGQVSLPEPIYDNGYGNGMTEPGIPPRSALPPTMTGGSPGMAAPEPAEMLPAKEDTAE